MVVALTGPYVPAGTGPPESARALQIRPPSAAQVFARVTTVPAGVQVVVVLDLSAHAESTQDPAVAVTAGVDRAVWFTRSVVRAKTSDGVAATPE